MLKRMAGIGLLVGYDDNSYFKGFDSEDNMEDFMDLVGSKWEQTFYINFWSQSGGCDLYTHATCSLLHQVILSTTTT
jgi:hypothetical protein